MIMGQSRDLIKFISTYGAKKSKYNNGADIDDYKNYV